MSDQQNGGSDATQELRERLAFQDLDATALKALAALKPVLDRAAPEALEKFYQRAMATPQTRAFLNAPGTIDRAKSKQIAHWRRLASGDLEGALEQTRRVGETHARIGLSPKWYAAGYGMIADHLIKAAVAHLWPKTALFGGSQAKAAEAGVALGALARVVLLDFELATSAYLDALEVRRAEAEAREAANVAEGRAAIDAVRRALAGLAANNLTCRIEDGLADAYAQMTSDYNGAISGLNSALSRIGEGLDGLSGATREIASASGDLSSRTEQDASSIEQSSAAIEEVATQVARTAEGAQAAQVIVTAAGAEAQQSNEIVENAISAMGRIEKSSSDIGKIIGAIDEIAFQTNLLALNAGVEAARAGEAGRGFAVVATEVRGLAQRSAEAAKENKALVGAASGEVAGGVKLVSATGEALARIVAKVGEMNAVVADILTSARQQSASLGEIKQAVGELADATQRNAAMAEQSTAASESIARETAALGELVQQFELGRAPARPPARPARAAGRY
jgi:methyl-accepting chemotaxis protein